MSSVNTIAVTALQTASVRLGVVANNLANALDSAPVSENGALLASLYAPQAVMGVSLANGGVQPELVPVSPAYTLGPDPTRASGIAAFPNVDVAAELVNMEIAATSYKAAAALINTSQQLDAALLGISA